MVAIISNVSMSKTKHFPMTYPHRLCEPYRNELPPNPTEDEIAWAYLKALYHEQTQIGIYYIFEPDMNKVDDAKCLRIVNRLAYLELAKKLNTEAGNRNWYMSITEKGSHAIERFFSLDQYEQYEQEQRRKNQPNSGIIIGGSVSGSQIGQSSSLGDLSVSYSEQSTPKAKRQSAATSTNEKWITWIVSIFGAIIAGLILLYIEHRTGFFTK